VAFAPLPPPPQYSIWEIVLPEGFVQAPDEVKDFPAATVRNGSSTAAHVVGCQGCSILSDLQVSRPIAWRGAAASDLSRKQQARKPIGQGNAESRRRMNG
jgi:hypothetical protein